VGGLLEPRVGVDAPLKIFTNSMTCTVTGEPLPDHEKCWNNAVPTLGHMALVGLMRAGKLQYIVSQNIDGKRDAPSSSSR
jgi:hypothetical protein